MKLRTQARKYKNPSARAVVNPSSRSPPMLSYEPPRTPSPAPLRAEETHGDSSGPSTTGVSAFPEAASDAVDPDFLKNHFKPAPAIDISQDIQDNVQSIREAGKEALMYKPASEALTSISKKFFELIDGTPLKQKLLERHKHLNGKLDTPLTFIDHHAHFPTHFPTTILCKVKDAPDLLAVFNPTDFTQKTEGNYKGVPHHRVVSIVEAKVDKNRGGRPQAASYAYRHQQARPDHPMLFCLTINPQWYQVILSSPNGVVASQQTSWENLDLLLAYVYSFYDPRDDHFLDDDTVRWNAPVNDKILPFWSIKFKNTVYRGHFVFVGDPWGRRTTVFRASSETDGQLIFKETYRHDGRRFKEEEILKHIHAEGDIPGVVRLQGWEYVCTGGKPLEIGSGNDIRRKVRLAFLDDGERLRAAKSVNDLLKACYDILEVHRTVYRERSVLHRDMSMYNILMYPRCPKVKGRRVFKHTPPFIKDVLGGSLRPLEDRTAECLMIDEDNAAMLDARPLEEDRDLADRTGTPMYIARSVCSGKPQEYGMSLMGFPMPTLTGEARDLYVKVHGQNRYDEYTEKNPSTRHGGIPPHTLPDPIPPFVHRPCHDAESIYWTIFAALLRAQPDSGAREKWATPMVAQSWQKLHDHVIPDDPNNYHDDRESFLVMARSSLERHFHPEMRQVAHLLHAIGQQVAPEYEFWKPRPPEEHLHEAMQRLILQYLVDHRNKDIPLDPENLRPTEPQPSDFS
ncbi:hypothetical protein C8T65DRAFT_802417 [Cerioporus squamosus]|nr:hypothetical protein C8T65DRAFT_802417 [Cerioporus squamosus]